MFLQGDETITLAPAASTVETISGVVADQTGSGGTRSNAGAGGLILDDPGTLDVDAANTFTGGTTIDQGVLELAKATAAGSGGIDFASTSGEVECAAGALANTITGFTGSDEIDFSTIAYTTGDHAVDNAGSVGIETSAGVTVATFKVNGTYTSANFKVGKDLSGDVLVTYAVAAANAAIDEIDGGSFADLLGRYAQFPMPIAETHNGLVGLDSCCPRFRARRSTPAISSTPTETSKAAAEAGASALAGTARLATGPGLAVRNAGRSGLRGERPARRRGEVGAALFASTDRWGQLLSQQPSARRCRRMREGSSDSAATAEVAGPFRCGGEALRANEIAAATELLSRTVRRARHDGPARATSTRRCAPASRASC